MLMSMPMLVMFITEISLPFSNNKSDKVFRKLIKYLDLGLFDVKKMFTAMATALQHARARTHTHTHTHTYIYIYIYT
jgi:hypothetical protein